MRRNLFVVTLLTAITCSANAVNLNVVPLNDEGSQFAINAVSHESQSDDREVFTLTIEHRGGEGTVPVQYMIKVIARDGNCKGRVRFTREVTVAETGQSSLNMILRTLDDGDTVFVAPLAVSGEVTETQRIAMGPDVGCFDLCRSMQADCATNCFPLRWCWYCDIPGCALLDCYCTSIEECPYPYQLGP